MVRPGVTQVTPSRRRAPGASSAELAQYHRQLGQQFAGEDPEGAEAELRKTWGWEWQGRSSSRA